jgi:hypothetical protein
MVLSCGLDVVDILHNVTVTVDKNGVWAVQRMETFHGAGRGVPITEYSQIPLLFQVTEMGHAVSIATTKQTCIDCAYSYRSEH